MTQKTASRKPDDDEPINIRISRVGSALSESFRALLQNKNRHPIPAHQITKTFGVNKFFSHRLVNALRKVDPLATIHHIPGPEPLRRFLKSAKGKLKSEQLLKDAETAVSSFENLIRHEGGDRSGLDAIISTWLPDARAKFESVAKQSGYRAMRQLKGIAADVSFFSTFLHLSEDDDSRFDAVQLRGHLGLRCVRPGSLAKIGVKSGTNNPNAMPLTLDGDPVQDPRGGVIIDEFCSGPPIELEIYEKGQDVIYAIQWGDAVGLNSALDIVTGDLRRNSLHRYLTNPSRPKVGFSHVMEVPAKMCICDVILHEDAFPNWEPRVRILETGELGNADPNDPRRDLDVLNVQETVESLGHDIQRFRAEDIPNYVDLLDYVCKKQNWAPEKFRGYRTRIEYPIFSSQVQFAFDLSSASS